MTKITIQEYQAFTPKTFLLPPEHALAYLFSGLAAEAGEVAGVYAKYVRGDFEGEVLVERASKEMGDTLYFLFQLANQLGLKVEDILLENKNKLEDRLARNVLKGDGDNR